VGQTRPFGYAGSMSGLAPKAAVWRDIPDRQVRAISRHRPASLHHLVGAGLSVGGFTCSNFITCYLGHRQSQGQRHARPGLLSPHSRKLSLWKYSSDIRPAGFGVGYPSPSLWLRPMYEAQGGLDLASRWTVLSADRRRIAGHAISVRNEDRGFSRLSDVWRDSDRNMHDRRSSVCGFQRKHVR
jgi:hypothetical protein